MATVEVAKRRKTFNFASSVLLTNKNTNRRGYKHKYRANEYNLFSKLVVINSISAHSIRFNESYPPRIREVQVSSYCQHLSAISVNIF